LFEQAKTAKLNELVSVLSVFETTGFTYEENVFCLRQDAAFNVMMVDACNSSIPDRYCFCTVAGVSHDFGDEEAFLVFKKALLGERNRIVRKYIAYKVKINACSTVAEIDDITINFSA